MPRAIWSARTSGLAVLRDVAARDAAWVLRYLVARRFGLPIGPRGPRLVHFCGLGGPVCIDPATGGLSAYYEIARVGVYGPPPPQGGVVVDVGANVGMFSAWAAGHVGPRGRLLALEPNPHSHGLAQRTLAGLGVRAELLRVAAGAGTGRLPLTVPPGRDVGATLLAGTDGRAVDVDVTALDEVVASAGIDHVDLLKIDVEGWEREALTGAVATLERTAAVAVETTADLRGDVGTALLAAGLEAQDVVRGVWGHDDLCVVRARRP